MSTLESVFWHILGYSAMPLILVFGFLVTACIGCFLLEMTGNGGDE
jgi:uncharacterized protein (TIGR02808 family)